MKKVNSSAIISAKVTIQAGALDCRRWLKLCDMTSVLSLLVSRVFLLLRMYFRL